jgi:hypothetical protein
MKLYEYLNKGRAKKLYESRLHQKFNLLNEGMKDWAINELKLAGLFDKDSDYEGMIGKSVAELFETFTKQGHSGMSAMMTSEIFHKLVNYEPLTECDHSEYEDRTEMNVDKKPLFQCKRCMHFFSDDGGKSWYDVRKK